MIKTPLRTLSCFRRVAVLQLVVLPIVSAIAAHAGAARAATPSLYGVV